MSAATNREPWVPTATDHRRHRRRSHRRAPGVAAADRQRGGLQVVAEAGTVPDAERLTRAHRPSVLVLDLNMPGGSSLEAIARLREDAPDTSIVVLTMQDDPAFARQALRSGALGFVLKEAADEELLRRSASPPPGHLPQPAPRRPARRRAQRARRPARRPHRTRARGPAPDRPRAHQHRDGAAALPLHAHGRDPPRAHPAEARRTSRAELVRYALEHALVEI